MRQAPGRWSQPPNDQNRGQPRLYRSRPPGCPRLFASVKYRAFDDSGGDERSSPDIRDCAQVLPTSSGLCKIGVPCRVDLGHFLVGWSLAREIRRPARVSPVPVPSRRSPRMVRSVGVPDQFQPAVGFPNGFRPSTVNEKAKGLSGGGLRLLRDVSRRCRLETSVMGGSSPARPLLVPTRGAGTSFRVHVHAGDGFPVRVYVPDHPAVSDLGAHRPSSEFSRFISFLEARCSWSLLGW